MSLSTQKKSSITRIALAGSMFMLVALISSCSTSGRDEALLSGDEPVDKNTPYPDFSKPLTSAMPQMSDEEAKKQDAQLSALAARRRSGAISEAEYWRRVREMRALNESMPQPTGVE